MSADLPSETRIVVIGGGVIGASVAWHLTRLGCPDVVVLECGQIGCGTTWHSAGNIIRMSTDPVAVGIYAQSASIVAELDQRHSIGWRPCGRVMLARTEERLKEFDIIIRTLHEQGAQVELISPEDVQNKLPIMNTDDLVGALWSPGDGRVDPTALTAAYCREAKQNGARFLEGVNVKQAVSRANAVTGVDTDQGQIRCEVVVNCAGMWARDIGLKNNVDIPLYAVEHFYALTESLVDVYPDMPTFRDPDGLIYGREEVGGLLVGCFDRDALPVRLSELPAPFEFALLNENWDQFMPYMEQAILRIPALADCGIRALVNGPESFTPDAEAHLDEAPELKNYFVLAGLSSSGVTRSGGMGGVLARWILEGDPGLDLSRYSLKRFGPEHNREDYLRRRVRDMPSAHFGLER
ncbi:MAG: FAD-binding oxidoreductase [Arenicellales bacterium]|nr:FAD-binding oxidoreductase [Arenicellales bacterium]MDP6791004.1 FAD-binding oxidoreductase [Arenicellales bacterium]MDP6919012.1 FAD-binding oxidoreductase [Arenicellales bacterium]